MMVAKTLLAPNVFMFTVPNTVISYYSHFSYFSHDRNSPQIK